MTTRRTLIVLGILFALAGFVGGCVASAQSEHNSRRKTTIKANGEVTTEYTVASGSQSTAPGATSQPTIADASDEGATAAASGQQSKPLAAYGIEQRQIIFYGTGAVLIVGAAVSFWLGQRMLAFCLLAASGVLLIVPTFITVAAPYVAGFAGVFIVGAGIWYVASWYRARIASHASSVVGGEHLAKADRLARVGDKDGAIDEMRTATAALSVNKPVFAKAIDKEKSR